LKRTKAEAGEDELEEKPDVITTVIPEVPDLPTSRRFPIGIVNGKRGRADQMQCIKFILPDKENKDSCTIRCKMELESGATCIEGVIAFTASRLLLSPCLITRFFKLVHKSLLSLYPVRSRYGLHRQQRRKGLLHVDGGQ